MPTKVIPPVALRKGNNHFCHFSFPKHGGKIILPSYQTRRAGVFQAVTALYNTCKFNARNNMYIV